METNILMESGTNELEVLEFTVGNNHYGINVAKIKEIVQYSPVTPVPNSHPCVEGIFMPRDLMITVVDLAKVIKAQPSPDITKDMFIITNFNQLNVAFHVHSVVGIHRVSWADISPETGLKVSEISGLEGRQRNDSHIMIVEDSALLIKLISDSLTKSGYNNLTLCNNGQEAWNYLMKVKSGEEPKDVKCIITDIEMPLMDGHRLTKLVKTDNDLKSIPVVIFSSLINEQMRLKGESLGADVQLSKPEIGLLVQEIDKLLLK